MYKALVLIALLSLVMLVGCIEDSPAPKPTVPTPAPAQPAPTPDIPTPIPTLTEDVLTISGLEVTNITTNSADIGFNTSIATSASVNLLINDAIVKSSFIDAAKTLSHSVTMTGLVDNTTYDVAVTTFSQQQSSKATTEFTTIKATSTSTYYSNWYGHWYFPPPKPPKPKPETDFWFGEVEVDIVP